MHILWYSGVELPAVTGEELTRAGWQEGLRAALARYCPEIKLSIASFGARAYPPFEVENATYYNILRDPSPEDRWARLIQNWQHDTFRQEDLERSYAVYQQTAPDLVFIFGTENPFGLLSGRFTVPAVISIQAVLNGLVPSLLAGLSFQEQAEEFFSRSTITGQGIYHKLIAQRKLARVERQIYLGNRYFCGRTDWDRSWQEKLNPGARYFHIDRVLRQEYYSPVWEIGQSEKMRVFSLSGNAPFKGGLTLVRAAALLKRRGDVPIRLRLGGIGEESSVGRYIRRMVAQAGLQDQVALLGRLGTREILQEMKAASLFVLPSHMDNSPNSLAEAMMLGMPCVASDAGGIPSMIREGREGLLYPHQDTRALADKMAMLLKAPELAAELGAQARAAALDRHDPEKIAQDTRAMYRQVLADWKAK